MSPVEKKREMGSTREKKQLLFLEKKSHTSTKQGLILEAVKEKKKWRECVSCPPFEVVSFLWENANGNQTKDQHN